MTGRKPASTVRRAQPRARDLERRLARSVATGETRGERPAWWWAEAPEATGYRDDPGRFERPAEYVVSSETVPEAWMRAGIAQRRVSELGRLRFLAAAGLLSPAEVERILAAAVRSRAAGSSDIYELRARVVREELARRGRR
jgi:hypothetical protein